MVSIQKWILFLKIRIWARKSVFCCRTPDSIIGLFVALGETIDSDLLCNFSLPRNARFAKKKNGWRVKKSSPTPLCLPVTAPALSACRPFGQSARAGYKNHYLRIQWLWQQSSSRRRTAHPEYWSWQALKEVQKLSGPLHRRQNRLFRYLTIIISAIQVDLFVISTTCFEIGFLHIWSHATYVDSQYSRMSQGQEGQPRTKSMTTFNRISQKLERKIKVPKFWGEKDIDQKNLLITSAMTTKQKFHGGNSRQLYNEYCLPCFWSWTLEDCQWHQIYIHQI